MPSLGFLKKKRTREAHPDPPSTTSQPTSPVTPTAGKNVDSQPAPTSAPATQQPQAAHEVVNAQQPEATAAATATNVQTDGSHTAPQQSTQMDHSATHQLPPQQHQQHQQHQQLQYVPAQNTPSPGSSESQNLPSILNLIHPAQHDGAAQQQQQQPQQYNQQATGGFPLPPTANGGAAAAHPVGPASGGLPDQYHHHQPSQPQAPPPHHPPHPQHPQQQQVPQYHPQVPSPPQYAQQPYQQQPQQPLQPPAYQAPYLQQQGLPPQQLQSQPYQQPFQQPQPQQPQQYQPQQHQQQDQNQAQNQTQMQQTGQQDQVRVTKGKYSLADFEILRTLGTGSFGRVHLVQSRHNRRFYAIKVLKKAQVVKMKQVEHTNDERRMLGEVKHPFLITLWGTFQDAKNLYMVMDFVEGGELFSLLRKSGRFPNPVAKFYAAEVTLALEYLHSKNIIYRDLKPENLLLDRHGHLKITDFGFAKRVPDKTWTLCGTPDYLAPEVVANKGYNKSVDWWSLGILIYEMLCGYTPFWDGGSAMKIYENILRGKVKYPAYINPDAQDLLERLITADITKRLGNLYGGSQDVKNHPWFAEVTWDRLIRKDIDAPYTPPVRPGAGDASQFDRYPEETEQYGQEGYDEYGKLFADF